MPVNTLLNIYMEEVVISTHSRSRVAALASLQIALYIMAKGKLAPEDGSGRTNKAKENEGEQAF